MLVLDPLIYQKKNDPAALLKSRIAAATVTRPMTVFNWLQRRLGWIAIPGLIRFVVAFTALVYLLTFINPAFVSMLTLDPGRVLHGQVWRLVTYIFIPQGIGQPDSAFGPFFLIMALWFLIFVGDRLEQAWGAFQLTLYFLIGMIGTTIAAFLFGAQFSNVMLASSLLFALGHVCPDEVIYVLFVLPMKIKWLAAISAAFLLFGFFSNPMSYRMALIVAFANYLIFFGPEIVRSVRHRQEVTGRRRHYEESSRPEEESLHRCATCGATEQTNANLEFRVSRDGEEYCLAHLPSAAKVEA